MDGVRIHHHRPLTPPAASPMMIDLQASAVRRSPSLLSIEDEEAPEERIGRMVSESPVVVLSRRSCYMCDVARRLLRALGAHPTVAELDEGDEGEAAARALAGGALASLPAVFIGGRLVGGVESLMALHVTARLKPMLADAGALSLATR